MGSSCQSPGGRPEAGPERLMRHVFAYHPEAERKLKGLQFIQVGNEKGHAGPVCSSLNLLLDPEAKRQVVMKQAVGLENERVPFSFPV